MTFGNFSENQKWKEYREGSDFEMEFLHRDEFETKYEKNFDYPIVLKGSEDLEVMISKKQLEKFKSIDELINAVKDLET